MDFEELILYQDEAILAVNKPAGLRTIVDGYDPSLPHLTGILRQYHPGILVVHRLDKDTSGIVLFAKNAVAHKHLNQQFQNRETRKEYHTIVLGVPGWQDKLVSLPLKVNGDRSHRTIVNEKAGKPAVTEFIVRQTYQFLSLIFAFPRSGYTHQIRTHLAAIGLPILKDPLYNSRLPETQAQREAQRILPDLPILRTALHAYQISFSHPTTGEFFTLTAPEPDDFSSTLTYLKGNL